MLIGEVTESGKVVDTMTRREQYESRTEELLLPILNEHNFELVDVEYIKEAGTWYLRAYIDKEGGITIDHWEICWIKRILLRTATSWRSVHRDWEDR